MTDQNTTFHAPLSTLSISPLNVRKIDDDVSDLVASIPVHGLMHPLTVMPHHKKKNHWHVLAGGRRYRALSVLAKHGSIDSDYSVPLRLYEGNDPQGVSLAENVIRAPMHAADQYSVFATLIRNGQTVEQVAANYGVSETVVKKRMKLGNLAPEILVALRRDEIDTHQAEAYTLADSKEAQLAIFNANPHAQAWMIKRDVTTGEVGSGNKKARFVTVEAYREAGGATRLDMFADRGDTEYLTDAALLEKLFHDKLNGIIEAVRAEGWQNVSYFDGADWQIAERFKGRIYATTELIDTDAQARVDEIDAELQALEEADEHTDETREAWDCLEVERATLFRDVYDPVEMASAEAVINVDSSGKAVIHRGLLKTAKQATAIANGEQQTETPANASYSAKVMDELAAVRTAMTANYLGTNIHTAMAATVHALACGIFLNSDQQSPLQIRANRANVGRDVTKKDMTPVKALNERLQHLRGELPDDHQDWLQFFLGAEYMQLGAWLAVLVSSSFKAHGFGTSSQAKINADLIAASIVVKPEDQVTLADLALFERCNKAKILAAVDEVKGADHAATLSAMKKADLVEVAERELNGLWLPAELQAFANEADIANAARQAEFIRNWQDDLVCKDEDTDSETDDSAELKDDEA
ncbi:ParB/RepB/Spo0J family partition protein [Ochrobactrum soli]|uniref:ParB/RepB/Spo0J family partition protein n=1 Tax=Ochrobactrum soli TaxID=2448455 RepID=A0A849KYI4_9HYPH|nr:ParB/RepB/Spo0J family partition protein [[Ochrobactrum] soli]NNU62986.1 ParB/RepB/Spo0J family partition protein [[Ochrobactrum] soli]